MKRTVRMRGAPSLLVACLLCLALACHSADREFDAHVARARKEANAGRFEQALVELRKALEIDPEQVEVHRSLAHVLERLGERESAVFHFEEAYRLDPTRPLGALEAARLLTASDPARAEALVAAALEQNPLIPIAYVRRAEIAVARGDLDGALAAAREVTSRWPDVEDGRMALAMVLGARLFDALDRGEPPSDEAFEEAIGAFDRVLENAQRVDRGRVLRERTRVLAVWPGHRDEAVQAYRALVEQALAAPDPSARPAALGAAIAFAREIEDDVLKRWVLESAIAADDSLLWAWEELAKLEQQETGSSDAVLERLRKHRPDDPEAQRLIARQLAAQGRLDDAKAVFERAAARGVAPARMLALLAQLLYESGQAEQADAIVARLEREHPESPELTWTRAAAALRSSDAQAAIDLLEPLVGSHESTEVQALLATAHLELHQLGAASRAIVRAEQLSPRIEPGFVRLRLQIDSRARRWPAVLEGLWRLEQIGVELASHERVARVRALYEVGRPAEADPLLEELLAEPEPPILATIEYARRGTDPARARALLERARARAPRHPNVLHELTRLDLAAGRPEEALARLDSSLSGSDAPRHASTALDRARVLVRLGRHEEAERDLLEVLQAFPHFREAADLLISLYEREGGLEAAIASFEEAERAGGLPPQSRVIFARLEARAGRLDAARASLERALAEQGDLIGAKSDLAWVLAETGAEPERALELAQDARSAAPHDPALSDTLGFVYLKQGLPELAADQFAHAIELAQDLGRENALFHLHHGLALEAVGRIDEAIRAFETATALDGENSEAHAALARGRATPEPSAAEQDPP